MATKPRRTNDPHAPAYVLACYDNGGKTADRYAVLFGGEVTDPSLTAAGQCAYLGMSASPTHPQGFSQWGECQTRDRSVHGKHVRWLDLPENIRRHVVARATAE